jgi:hypothetical protein
LYKKNSTANSALGERNCALIVEQLALAVWQRAGVFPRQNCQFEDRVFQKRGIAAKPVGPRAPNLNAFVERWIQSLKHEALYAFVAPRKQRSSELYAQVRYQEVVAAKELLISRYFRSPSNRR